MAVTYIVFTFMLWCVCVPMYNVYINYNVRKGSTKLHTLDLRNTCTHVRLFLVRTCSHLIFEQLHGVHRN